MWCSQKSGRALLLFHFACVVPIVSGAQVLDVGTGPGGIVEEGVPDYEYGIGSWENFRITVVADDCELRNEYIETADGTNLSNGDIEIDTSFDVYTYDCAQSFYNNYNMANPTPEELQIAASLNDAQYFGTKTAEMYLDLFGQELIPLSAQETEPKRTRLFANTNSTFSVTIGRNVGLGNGGSTYNSNAADPKVVAHEISHVFTNHHSRLRIQNNLNDGTNFRYMASESNALNESFSDMMGEVFNFVEYGGPADWIYSNIRGGGIRDHRCHHFYDATPGDPADDALGALSEEAACTIGPSPKAYVQNMVISTDEAQYEAAKVINHAFNFLATQVEGWTIMDAAKVFVKANGELWGRNENFRSAVCDLERSAEQLQYDKQDVTDAFAHVGLSCQELSSEFPPELIVPLITPVFAP